MTAISRRRLGRLTNKTQPEIVQDSQMALVQPDRRLLKQAQRGDEQAFAELVRMYEAPVFDYIRRLLPDRQRL